MIKLYDEGVYLVNGEKIVPESQAGAKYSKAEAKKGTIAYGIMNCVSSSTQWRAMTLRLSESFRQPAPQA